MPYRCKLRASRSSRAACASVRTGTGPSAAAIPPTASRVSSVLRAPNRAARNAAKTPAGPPPITATSAPAVAVTASPPDAVGGSVARQVERHEVHCAPPPDPPSAVVPSGRTLPPEQAVRPRQREACQDHGHHEDEDLDEPTERDAVTEDEVDDLKDDELGQEQDGEHRHQPQQPPARPCTPLEPTAHAVLRAGDRIDQQLQDDCGEDGDGERLGDDLRLVLDEQIEDHDEHEHVRDPRREELLTARDSDFTFSDGCHRQLP